MAIICQYCGNPMNDTAKFCASCGIMNEQPAGQPQQFPQPQAQQPPLYQQPQYQEPQYQPPLYQQPYAAAPQQPQPAPAAPAKKSRMPLVIAGVCAVALIVVLVATNAFGLFGKNGGPEASSSANGGNSGASGNTDSDGSNNSADNNSGDSDDNSSGDSDSRTSGSDNVQIKWEDYELLTFGEATFTADTAKTVSGNYTTDDRTPLALTVTDGNGLTWTLEIPADAYGVPVEISMTPLNDVYIGEYGEATGGVQLSPDGMLFLHPVKLTVSGAGITEDTIMFQGNHNGGDVMIAEYENGANSATTLISHFSIYLPYNPKLDKEAERQAHEQLLLELNESAVKAVAAAQDYLQNGPGLTPPPRLTFACLGGASHQAQNEADQREAMRYAIYDFMQPEQKLIADLACAKTEGTTAETIMELRKELAGSLTDKYRNLMAGYLETGNYEGDHNSHEEYWKAAAIVSVCFDSYRTDHREYFDPIQDSVLDDLFVYRQTWAADTWNDWMEILVGSHNYKAMHSLEEVARYNRMVDVVHDYEKLVANALTFTLEFYLDLTVLGRIQADGGITHIALKGGTAQFKLETERFGSSPEHTFYIGMVGKIPTGDPEKWATYIYDSYDFQYADVGEPFESIMIYSGVYDFFAYVLGFDPCTKMIAEISPIMIGGAAEIDDRPIIQRFNPVFVSTDTYSTLADDFMYCIQEKYMAEYGLECDIRNNDEKAVIQTFEFTGDYFGEISGMIELRLIHEPAGNFYLN